MKPTLRNCPCALVNANECVCSLIPPRLEWFFRETKQKPIWVVPLLGHLPMSVIIPTFRRVPGESFPHASEGHAKHSLPLLREGRCNMAPTLFPWLPTMPTTLGNNQPFLLFPFGRKQLHHHCSTSCARNTRWTLRISHTPAIPPS